MNNNWEYKKIGDICIVERGGSPRPINQFITDDENGINWIKIGDTTESMYITETAQKIKPEGMKKSRYVQPGDFLLSNSMSFGRPYILKIDGCIHDGWLVLRDKDDLFDKRFLYYYLSSKTTYEKFKSMAVGGVVNNLNSEMVRKVDVPIPSKMEQAKTADVLDKLNSVIVMYQQEIQKLDKLIQARFVEMFGSIHESTGYPYLALKDLSDVISGGTPSRGKAEFWNNGTIPWVKTTELKNNVITDVDEYITEEGLVNSSAKLVPAGTILVAMYGQGKTRGMTAYLDIEASTNQACACILPSDKIDSMFMWKYFELSYDKLRSLAQGAGQPNLNGNMIKNFKVLVPPIEMQKSYVNFVNQVDKSKVKVQKALDETQKLFDSLMQQYFG